MTKVIIWGMGDGSVVITHPAPAMFDPESGTRIQLGLELADDQAVLDFIMQKDRPANAVSGRVVDRPGILNDRTFRDAWEDTGAAIGVNMPKAREIFRNRLREARTSKLAELDVAYIRADEIGDAATKATIAQQKQVLRDVTDDPAIEAAQTPEALKAAWPDILKG